MILCRCAPVFLLAVRVVSVAWSGSYDGGSDLSFYVSRPDLRSPKMKVKTYDENAVLPGYIFTAPYYSLRQARKTHAFYPAQIGPHIYDSRGELVWSGAELTQNRIAIDFKLVTINGLSHLTLIVQEVPHRVTVWTGAALILNSNYDVVHTVDISQGYDVHEFLVLNNATSFLRVLARNTTTENILLGETVTIRDSCAAELDLQGNEIFRFCPSEKLGMNETMCRRPKDSVLRTVPWDLFHMNSVEKFSDGDYLTSVRYTSAIYRVSRTSGEVVWRLGGKLTDFEQNFNFSGQHDARIVSHNDTVTVISFFDNASVNMHQFEATSTVSSFKVVALYEKESPRRAVLLKQFDRPDGKQTRLRGSGQYHSSNGGAFVGWSDLGYATEFAPDGRVVQEAILDSGRFNSYRIYKADFVGMPSSLPDLKTFASLNDRGEMSMTSYVSWNGATEVATWEFFGSDEKEVEYESLGKITKTGFETSFVAHHAWKYTWVQARDGEGNVLGESETMETEHLASISIGAHDRQQTLTPAPIVELTEQPSIKLMYGLSATIAIFFVIVIAGLMGVGIATVVRFLWKRLGISYGRRHKYVLIGGK